MVGVRTRDRTIELGRPPITAMANGLSIPEPEPNAKASGSMPAMVASAVMAIGRSRRRPERISDSSGVKPSARNF